MGNKHYKSVKTALYGLLDFIGLNAWSRRRNRHRIRVFALHGVGSYSGDHDWVPIRPQHDVADLERMLTDLCRNYRFISIGDATAIMNGNAPAIDNAAVLTFDDGYLNNFTQALPVLRKLKVPGVFYIATGMVETREPFWFDRLDFVLQAAAKEGAEVELAGKTFHFDKSDRESIRDTFSQLRFHCKRNYPDDREFAQALGDVATTLEHKTGVSLAAILEGDEWACVVSRDDVQRYSRDDLVTFGGHTVSHLRLSCSSEEDIARELHQSKQSIEAWTGRPCLDFSYPNGDYDDASVAAVKSGGYQSAVTSDIGMESVGSDPCRIKRLNLPVEFTNVELRGRASGLEEAVMSLMARLKGRRH